MKDQIVSHKCVIQRGYVVVYSTPFFFWLHSVTGFLDDVFSRKLHSCMQFLAETCAALYAFCAFVTVFNTGIVRYLWHG